MKSFRKELWFETPHRRDYLNITNNVEEVLRERGIKEGIILVNAMHITASIFINDDEAGLHSDFEVWLEKLAPEKPHSQYRHNGYEDKADAHLKRQIMVGKYALLLLTANLNLVPEQIFYGNSMEKEERVLWKIIVNNLFKNYFGIIILFLIEHFFQKRINKISEKIFIFNFYSSKNQLTLDFIKSLI